MMVIIINLDKCCEIAGSSQIQNCNLVKALSAKLKAFCPKTSPMRRYFQRARRLGSHSSRNADGSRSLLQARKKNFLMDKNFFFLSAKLVLVASRKCFKSRS